MHLIKKGSIGRDVHGLESATTVSELKLGFTEIGLGIRCIHHLGGSRHDSLCTLLGTTAAPRGSLLGAGTTLLLEIHHTPHNQDEDDHMHEETRSRWAPSRGRDPRTKNSPDKTESLGVGDNEKCETRNERSDELLLLLPTITSTTAVFKKTHDYF